MRRYKEFQGADLKLSSGVYAYTHAAQIETTAMTITGRDCEVG